MSVTRHVGTAALLGAIAVMNAPAANCDQTSVDRIPINDMGTGLYLNQYQGGLYPGGSNVVPPPHANVGVQRALSIRPLLPNGQPSPNGRSILLSIGMSNTSQEFSVFRTMAMTHPLVNHDDLVIINGAAGGQTAGTWDSPTDQNYDRIATQILAPLGLSEAQVQAAWVKVANAQPSAALPSDSSEAHTLLGQMGDIIRALRVRYPNLKVVFHSSRIYAGYASTPLNPEPYAYESAFAVKWLVQAQIQQMAGGGVDPAAGDVNFITVAPWIAWGPYLWADGLVPRSDGLIWQCSDLMDDGTHPSPSGREKVADMLMDFMLTSPFAAPWFRVNGPADLNGDKAINGLDLGILLASWSVPPGSPGCGGAPPGACPADLNHDGRVNGLDLGLLLSNWTI